VNVQDIEKGKWHYHGNDHHAATMIPSSPSSPPLSLKINKRMVALYSINDVIENTFGMLLSVLQIEIIPSLLAPQLSWLTHCNQWFPLNSAFTLLYLLVINTKNVERTVRCPSTHVLPRKLVSTITSAMIHTSAL
jgi:hypothetical protein